jgi:DHA1 family multidrug resistance protein-like MFS transporter/DHA1 family quinolone resistance protein-like MFS transporter
MTRVLLLAYIQACVVGIAYGAYVPLVPVFAREELAATYFDIGLIGMANYVPYMFAPAIVGLLLDRFNKASVLSIGISLAMFSTFMLSFTQNVMDAMLIRAIAGLAHAFFWPATVALVTTRAPEEKRVQAISNFTMSWVGGYMIGPLIGAFLFEQSGFRQLFEYSAIIMIASLAIALQLIKHGRVPIAEKYSISTVFSIMKSNPRLSTLVMYYSASFGIVLTVLPAYMKDNMVSEFFIGLLFFLFGVSRLLTLPLTQKFAKRERTSIFVATQTIALAMLIVYSMTTIESFSFSFVMYGFAFSLYFPITLSIATRQVPRNVVGSIVGAYETIFGIGWAAGPIIAGLVAYAYGSNIPYIAMFIIGIMLPFIILKRSK